MSPKDKSKSKASKPPKSTKKRGKEKEPETLEEKARQILLDASELAQELEEKEQELAKADICSAHASMELCDEA
ncbi:MAG: hypothetical protein ACFFDU_09530, partial [Candidatus Thorarchaeota archaeon]